MQEQAESWSRAELRRDEGGRRGERSDGRWGRWCPWAGEGGRGRLCRGSGLRWAARPRCARPQPLHPPPRGVSRPHARPHVRVMTVSTARSRRRGSSRGPAPVSSRESPPARSKTGWRGRRVRLLLGGEIPSDLTFPARRPCPSRSCPGAVRGSVKIVEDFLLSGGTSA